MGVLSPPSCGERVSSVLSFLTSCEQWWRAMAPRSAILPLLLTSVACALHVNGRPPVPTCVSLRLPRSPLASAPLECETAEGQALARLLAEAADGSAAQRAWEIGLARVPERLSSAAVSEVNGTSLAARVAQLRQLTSARAFVADCLRLRVAQTLQSKGLQLIPALSDIAPAAVLSSATTSLAAAQRAMPAEAGRQLETFLGASAPSDNPEINGRFDRLQGAQLYMGHVQFGYFLAQVFRGTAHLVEQQVVSAAVARGVKDEIESATTRMKTDAAWGVASVRAGDYFELEEPGEGRWQAGPGGGVGGGGGGGDTGMGDRGGVESEVGGEGGVPPSRHDDRVPPSRYDGGVSPSRYEELRDFTTGVEVVAPALVEEFFNTGDTGGRDSSAVPIPGLVGEPQSATETGAKAGGGEEGRTDTLPAPLPRASFVRFNAAGLQALCCEACVVGYVLWGAEREAMTLLGEEASSVLMPAPPARGGEGARRG
jgi:hypothetical protein